MQNASSIVFGNLQALHIHILCSGQVERVPNSKTAEDLRHLGLIDRVPSAATCVVLAQNARVPARHPTR